MIEEKGKVFLESIDDQTTNVKEAMAHVEHISENCRR